MSLETVDLSRLELTAGQRVLDLGCGEGRHALAAYLTEPVHVVGVDISRSQLDVARERYGQFHADDSTRSASFILANGQHLPFADSAFDRIICAEVLEHVTDYRSMLAEIHRVLKPGGVLAVSVPRFGPEWICWRLSTAYHQVAGGHVRIFKAGELRRAIQSTCAGTSSGCGFSFMTRHWAHGLHSPYWWLRCLLWEHGEAVWPVRWYHRLLVWDLMRNPPLTRWLERLLNPLIGKSVVMYFQRATS